MFLQLKCPGSPLIDKQTTQNTLREMVGKFMFAMPLLQHLAIKFKSHASPVHTTSPLYQRTTMKTITNTTPPPLPLPINTENGATHSQGCHLHSKPFLPELQKLPNRAIIESYSNPTFVPTNPITTKVENLLNFLHYLNLLNKSNLVLKFNQDVIKLSSHILGTIYIHNVIKNHIPLITSTQQQPPLLSNKAFFSIP